MKIQCQSNIESVNYFAELLNASIRISGFIRDNGSAHKIVRHGVFQAQREIKLSKERLTVCKVMDIQYARFIGRNKQRRQVGGMGQKTTYQNAMKKNLGLK